MNSEFAMIKTHMNNLNQLLLFAKVVETGSFSETARQLGIGKSAVSMQISKLERQLGVKLLHRSTRQISLSEAGEIYFQSCALISEEVTRANERIKLFKNEVSGFLKITCPIGFGNRVLLPALAAFFDKYPDVNIEVVLDDRDVNLVEEGIDVAIRVASLPDSSMIAKPLVCTSMVVCAAQDYYTKAGMPECFKDMENHQWVLSTHTPTKLPYQHDGFQSVININGKIKVNNEQARLNLALAGYGLSLMPAYEAWDSIKKGLLIEVDFDIDSPQIPITALYHDRKYVPKKLSIFIDYFKQYLLTQEWAIK